MSKTSMGSLVVTLSANASAFEKVLEGAEKRLVGFAAKAASPINYISKIGNLGMGNITAPIAVATGAVQTLTDMIDKVGNAIDPLGARLFNPQEFKAAADNVMQDIAMVAREAKKLDFDPRLVAGMRMAAPHDADAMIAGAKHYESTLGEAVFGGGKQTKDGVSNKSVFEQLGLDPKKLAGMSTQEGFLTTIQAFAGLKDKTAEMGIAMQLAGRGGREGAEGLKNLADHLPQIMAKVDKSGLYTPEKIQMAERFEQRQRDIEFRKKVHDAREMEAWGSAKDEAEETMKNSSITSGDYWDAKARKNKAEAVGRARRFGSNAVLPDEYQSHEIRSLHNDEAIADRAPKPTAEELLQTRAKKEAADASAKLREELDKETTAIYGQTAAEKVAAANRNELTAPEDKAKNLESLHQHDIAKPTHEIDEMTTRLYDQNETWGKTTDYAKIYEATLKGVDAGKIAAVTKELEKQEGLKLKDDTATPMEKFQKEAERLQGLHDKGAIDDKLYRRGMAKAFKGVDADAGDYKLAPSALKGSAEDVHQINQQYADRQKSNRSPADIAEEALEAQKAIEASNARIAAAADAMKNAPVVGMFPED